MRYIIVAFKSRNETLYFANLFMKNGYRISIVNTPSEIGHSCGISVQINQGLLSKAKDFLAIKPFKTFYGIFSIERRSGKSIVIKL
ncbi:MAG: DUF3343 domain-containing protein [Clostridiales bacterium]|nr:DUF3343 domain-containing protein [Clostridiales bacterium]